MQILFDAAFEILLGAYEVFGLEAADRVLHLAWREIHDRIARALLVTGINQRIQRQRILIGRYDRLLDQAADDAGLDLVQLW